MKLLAIMILTVVYSEVLHAGTYDQVRPKIWDHVYPDGGWTLYCNERFPGVGDVWRRTAGLQLEHVYPAKWMVDYLKCGSRKRCKATSDLFNTMESDPHNIWPALTQYNQMRKAYRFGEVPGEKWRFSGCDFELGEGNTVEPSIAARGHIARSMLYMRDTYGLPINDALMERWGTDYPETAEERRRNIIIPTFWPKR